MDEKLPAEQGKIGYGNPPRSTRFKPGQSGNPKGRPSAGASLREWLNVFVAQELTEDQLQKIARCRSAPVLKRAAAIRALGTLEWGDIADFMGWLDGTMSLEEL